MNDTPDIADLIGLPFELNGRYGKTKGLDCYGLMLEVEKRIGRELPDFVYDNPNDIALKDGLLKHTARKIDLSKEKILAGDVGVQTVDEDNNLHLAVAINGRELIHAIGKKVRITDIKRFIDEGMEFYTWDR